MSRFFPRDEFGGDEKPDWQWWCGGAVFQRLKWLRVKVIMIFVKQNPVIPQEQGWDSEDEWAMRR